MNTTSVSLALAGAAMLAGVFFQTTEATEDATVIRFGVLPINEPETMQKRFSPLMEYLERETGYDFELRLYSTGSKSGGYNAAVRGLLSGDTPLAYLAPVTMSQARHHDPRIEPVVCAVRGGSHF